MSSPNTSNSHIEQRIDLLTKELASKRRSTNWSTNLTLIIGLLAILALCGYFGYGYNELNNITKPDQILAAASIYLDEYSVEARKAAAVEVRKSAPVWAKEASKELVANMPTLREKTEESVAQYFDSQLQAGQNMTRGEFEIILRDNRDDFEEAINLIVEEGNSDEFVDQVLPIIEKNYGRDMKANVAKVLGGLQDMSRRIDKLARGKNLNPIEEQQRQILGLTRRLRDE
jgi:hypothetical protein